MRTLLPLKDMILPAASVRFASGLGAVLAAMLLVTAPASAQNTAPAAAPADSGLQQRVEQLEEQLVDMQVTVGTLESLARGGSPAASSGGDGSSAAEMRIDGLETQLRAMSAQIEQLTRQVRDMSGVPGQGGAAAPATAPMQMPATMQQPLTMPPPATSGSIGGARFGSTTVTAGTGDDAIGGLIDNGAPSAAGATSESAGAETLAAAPPAFMPPPHAGDDAQNPKQLYETAYGYLMQRDYGAAQAAFEDFLSRYPQDSLAGNAQYWLGEAYFVRGDYKSAAGAFLKGYQNYASNARAADSLLKLAMSLDRLGQTDAACSSFGELSTRFPNAPENVTSRAKSERQRIGCR